MTAEQQEQQEEGRGRFDLVYILREDADEADGRLRAGWALVEAGATIEHTESWGTRRMAYPIDGQRKGQYVFTRFEVERERLADLRAALKEVPGMLRASIMVAIGALTAEAPGTVQGLSAMEATVEHQRLRIGRRRRMLLVMTPGYSGALATAAKGRAAVRALARAAGILDVVGEPTWAIGDPEATAERPEDGGNTVRLPAPFGFYAIRDDHEADCTCGCGGGAVLTYLLPDEY